MAGVITIPGMFLTGTHAARPAATAVGSGSLYACSDHGLIYQSNGAAWSTWATLGATVAFAGARVHNNAALTIPNNTPQAMTFNSERYDTDGYHDTGSNTSRLTIPTGKGGKYLVTAHVSWTANATGLRQLYFKLGAGTVIATSQTFSVHATEPTRMSLSTVYDIAAAEYVEAFAQQTTGGNLDIVVAAAYSPEFSVSLLR